MNPENAKSTSLSAASEFKQSVLQLKPRLAVFDCDGTLWSGDAGFGFFDWELKRGLVADDVVRWARARYEEYLAGKVSEDDMCAEMVTINRGLARLRREARRRRVFRGGNDGRFFPRDKRSGCGVAQNGCEIWAVSSTSEWVIQAGMKHFGIPRSRILAAAVAVEDGKVTDKVIRVPSGKGKPLAIREVIARPPMPCLGIPSGMLTCWKSRGIRS